MINLSENPHHYVAIHLYSGDNHWQAKKVTDEYVSDDFFSQLDGELHELGSENFPEGIEDIRGMIHDEPSRVFALVWGDDVTYFGLEPATTEEAKTEKPTGYTFNDLMNKVLSIEEELIDKNENDSAEFSSLQDMVYSVGFMATSQLTTVQNQLNMLLLHNSTERGEAHTFLASKPSFLKTVFVAAFDSIATEVNEWACDAGFWPEGEDRNDGEMLCLIHSEVSEALEALRAGNPPDKHLPKFSAYTVELADVIIRIMDLAIARELPIAEAILAKIAFNQTRPEKNGKEF